MTVTVAANTVTWLGNGATTVFSYTFAMPAASYATLLYTTAAGVQSTVAPAAYSITGVGQPTAGGGPQGGTVSYAPGGSPIPAGSMLTLIRTVPYSQLTSLSNQGGLWPGAVEGSDDALEMQIQQLAWGLNRALLFNPADVGPFGTFPPAAQRAGQLLGFDANGNPIAAQPSSALVSSAMQPVVDASSTAAALALLGGTPPLLAFYVPTGLDPTGATDCAAIIQAAVTANLVVHLPAGVFKLASTVTLQPNQVLAGSGAGTTTIFVDFAGPAFQFLLAATAIVNIVVERMTISGGVAGATGVKFVFCDAATVRACTFAGLTINVEADRGWRFLCQDCVSTGNVYFQSGQMLIHSSVDEVSTTLQYIFSPSLINYRVNTGAFDAGVVEGSATPAIYVRRSAGAVLQDCNIDHGEIGATPPTFILIENDNQGMNIIGGSSHGCAIGILIQPGTGLAAVGSYIDIINHSVDYFSYSGIQVAATTVASTMCGIYGGALTAATGANVPYIDLANCIDWVISGVRITDYTTAKNGIGLYLNSDVTVTMSSCIFDSINVAWDLANATEAECYFTNNVVKNCTTPLTGSFAGNLNRVVGNYGINPMTVTTPAMPASNAGPLGNNTGTDVTIYVSGGSGISAIINGVSVPGAGPFFAAAQGYINITYTTAPTWVWVGS